MTTGKAKGKGALREVMPTVAQFVDAMREAFGAESIDDSIRRGMRGEATFAAQENGQAIGHQEMFHVNPGAYTLTEDDFKQCEERLNAQGNRRPGRS